MASDPSQSMLRSRFRLRSRAGGVAVMALIIAIVTVTFFQSYLLHVITDQRSGVVMDQYTQMQGERMAIERIVKESVLQYYEGQWVTDRGTAPSSANSALNTLIEGYLGNLYGMGGRTFEVTIDPMPVSYGADKSAFWPNLKLTGGAIDTTPLAGGFSLVPVNLDALGLPLRRVAAYMPVRDKALQVQANGGADVFTCTVARSTAGAVDYTFTVYLRLYQVPATDFNLVSFALANAKASIPNDPPALPAAISASVASGSLRTLCMSRMATDNSLNDGTGLQFPYSYRELFSSASLLWEYVCYCKEYISFIIPKNNFRNATNTANVAMAYYTLGSLSQLGSVNGAVPSDTCYIDNFRNAAGVIQTTVDPLSGATLKVRDANLWRIDLDKVPAALIDGSGTNDTHRRIYVQVRGDTADAVLEIKDSAHGSGVTTPVIIWLNGWSVTTASGTPNTIVRLVGDLGDQQVFIFGAGVTIQTENATMKGAIILDDDTASLVSTAGTFNLTGSLVARNGAVVDFDHINLTAGNSDLIRAIAPRFLVVDAQSTIQY